MGDTADDMYDNMELAMDEGRFPEEVQLAIGLRAQNGIWQSKDGERWHISQMSDVHLQNTYNWLGRQHEFPFADEYREQMLTELRKRGHKV